MHPAHLVWFKRDLRIHDHRPLLEASRNGPVIGFYCFEPSQTSQPDYSSRHRAFILECIGELSDDLHSLRIPMYVFQGEVIEFLNQVRGQVPIAGLWAHQETGNLASFKRDKEVAAWCDYHQLTWREFPQQGVVRRLKSRDGWGQHWENFVSQSVAPTPAAQGQLHLPRLILREPPSVAEACENEVMSSQRGGRRAAVTTLDDFLDRRASQYRGGISSPLNATSACSRLSPYLAWGSLSLREVVWATRKKMYVVKEGSSSSSGALRASLRSFEGRLHWHCHFIQKLESQPDIEIHNMHRGYDGLRDSGQSGLLESWSRGETGYPLVDACMAMLRSTGWLNFRMRAMLMSFAAYNLWLDWRVPGHHLARYFLDYEPGIHWPQVQMQSGVTGINALRIYNPVKQAIDHDPKGIFVRRWIPALRQVPDRWLFEPWKMPPLLQERLGVIIDRDYPAPIIDLQQSARLAKARFAAWRTKPGMAEMSQSVLTRHGSRKSSSEHRTKRKYQASTTQQDLFDFGDDTECIGN